MKVLGIDPGYDRLGIALLSGDASKQTYVHSECFTPAKGEFLDRLYSAGEKIREVIAIHKPSSLAIESLFVTNNQKTAMRVGELRGVILYEARRAGLSVAEYGPSQIKLAVTGYGKSDKDSVTDMVKRLVKIPDEKRLDDEYDAIAVAITHLACGKK
ncbi:MAG: crossover junction endodeoxyribonuclease RuvC [Candidatus Pacebacteria bacterium]|nr:crossover junction endodeoxyribonuclease RuvC [Candidatus Paceibacterota bacterium]